MICILIPAFGSWERLTKCVNALQERTHRDDVQLLINYENFEFGKPRGYTLAANELLKSALMNNDCSEIVLVNNDTEILTDRWLDKIHDYVKDYPEIGVVAIQELMKFDDGEYSLLPHSGKKCLPGQGEIEDLVYAGFAFVWIKRDVLDKVGLLDMRFNPGHYEDYDFGVRTWIAGYRVIWLPKIQYRHERGVTFASLVDKGICKYPNLQAKLFHEKWKDIITEGESSIVVLNRLKELSLRTI